MSISPIRITDGRAGHSSGGGIYFINQQSEQQVIIHDLEAARNALTSEKPTLIFDDGRSEGYTVTVEPLPIGYLLNDSDGDEVLLYAWSIPDILRYIDELVLEEAVNV